MSSQIQDVHAKCVVTCADKLFSCAIFRVISVPRIFDWGSQLQITCNDVIRNFLKKNFLLDKDIIDCKIRSVACDGHITWILRQEEGLNTT